MTGDVRRISTLEVLWNCLPFNELRDSCQVCVMSAVSREMEASSFMARMPGRHWQTCFYDRDCLCGVSPARLSVLHSTTLISVSPSQLTSLPKISNSCARSYAHLLLLRQKNLPIRVHGTGAIYDSAFLVGANSLKSLGSTRCAWAEHFTRIFVLQ